MRISNIDHCAIRTVRVEECKAFYRDVLGFVEGPRPPFSVKGIWFYSDEHPLVHVTYVNEIDDPAPQESERLARRGGYLDHIAFRAQGLAEMIQRLERHRIPFNEVTIPSLRLYQLFFRDPDGVSIELDYSTDEAGVVGRSPRIVA